MKKAIPLKPICTSMVAARDAGTHFVIMDSVAATPFFTNKELMSLAGKKRICKAVEELKLFMPYRYYWWRLAELCFYLGIPWGQDVCFFHVAGNQIVDFSGKTVAEIST